MMKEKRKDLRTILSLITVILSVAAIVVSCITIFQKKENKIQDYYGIGVISLYSDTITNMYIDEGESPYLFGYFYDETVLEDVKEIIRGGTYQLSSTIKSSKDIDDEVLTHITFYGEQHEYYYFSAYGRVVGVSIDGETKYYNSNIYYTLQRYILSTASSIFGEAFG